MNRTRSVRLLAVLATAGLLVAACGDDDDDAASDGTEAPAVTEAPPAPTRTARHRGAGDRDGGDRGDRRRRPTRRRSTSDGSGEGGTIRLWLNGEPTRPTSSSSTPSPSSTSSTPTSRSQLERQQWTGIVERLTTALSGNDAPDIVEFGNTQAQAFEAAGAVVDLTDQAAELGGDDFLQSLLEAGTYDGTLYAVPYYAGARIMIYRKDLFEASGIEIPTTLEEMVAAGEQLKADNADVPNFSGIYLPGRNWHAAMSFVWDARR